MPSSLLKSFSSPSILDQRQYVRPVGANRDGMLEMSGPRAIAGDDGPAILACDDVGATDVDHGLDREDLARQQTRTPRRRAVVRHLGFLVHLAPDPVAH